jgi:hypothetical protein
MNTTRNEGRVLALSAPLEAVTFDIYRDIHKGIRAELFGVTSAAGNIDPHDDQAVRALGRRFHALVGLLDSHAEHEDRYLTPLIERRSGPLALTITNDHVSLERDLHALSHAVDALPTTKETRRLAAHRFYLGVSSFTAEYLEHQAIEELQVMPTLATGYTVEELLRVNAAIIADIPPDTMAASLSLLLPAMNVDDRTELLAGMKAAAPPEAFAGVLGLARAVLPPADFAALASRVAA